MMKHVRFFWMWLVPVVILVFTTGNARAQEDLQDAGFASVVHPGEAEHEQSMDAVFPVGNMSVTFSDPDRDNRNIPTEVYYPAISGGNNAPFAEGVFPLLVFGHGFAMNYDSYQYLWEALVPLGYILAFPTTEASIIPFPDHADFGLDMAFLVAEIKALGLQEGSAFFGKVSANAAVMGHSMGGGAAFLAAADNEAVATVITFAPAETDPSAIAAAALAKGSVLIFAGENDCVTPIAEHQLPMFNNAPEGKKMLVTINGGGHCYFGDYNFFCSFGENSCSPDPAISRATQHQITLSLLAPFLAFQLKGKYSGWEDFQNELTNQDVQTENGWTNVPVPAVVDLEPGWNSFSFSHRPVDRTFAYLAAGMGEHLLYFSDGSDAGFTGQDIPANYFPDTESGYFVKVADSVTLEFAAYPRTETSFMLEAGWQLLPVLSGSPVSIGDLFQEGSPQFEIIQEVAGVEVNWPATSVSTLQVLQPNRAYRVKMMEAGEIVFP